MRCEEARIAYLQGEPGEGAATHLEGCPDCRSITPQLIALRGSLEDPGVWVEPPAGLEDRVMMLIDERHPDGRRTGRRRWWPGGVAVGLVLTLGAVAVVVGTSRSTPPDWEISGDASGGAAVMTVAGWNAETGTRLVVSASGLDPAPPGHTYELWFSHETAHISAGTFNSVEDPVHLTVGISRRDYPRVWLTVEPLHDGDPSSSRDVVFDHHG